MAAEATLENHPAAPPGLRTPDPLLVFLLFASLRTRRRGLHRRGQLFAINAELRKHGGNIQPHRLELLEQAEHQRRPGARDAPDAPRAVARPTITMLDDHYFVNIPEGSSDGAENARRGFLYAPARSG